MDSRLRFVLQRPVSEAMVADESSPAAISRFKNHKITHKHSRTHTHTREREREVCSAGVFVCGDNKVVPRQLPPP